MILQDGRRAVKTGDYSLSKQGSTSKDTQKGHTQSKNNYVLLSILNNLLPICYFKFK